jgi:hypothetical protein
MTLGRDICYDTEPTNVERLATVLRDWKAYLRGVEPVCRSGRVAPRDHDVYVPVGVVTRQEIDETTVWG